MSRGALAHGGPTTGTAPMKHKTLFRLVIKAIGVLLIGLSLPGLATFFGLFIVLLAARPFGAMGPVGQSG